PLATTTVLEAMTPVSTKGQTPFSRFPPPPRPLTPASGPRIVLIAMFLSGTAAFINEVARTRVLALVIGPTTYARTLMLCSMIAGLGLGAALGSRVRPE